MTKKLYYWNAFNIERIFLKCVCMLYRNVVHNDIYISDYNCCYSSTRFQKWTKVYFSCTATTKEKPEHIFLQNSYKWITLRLKNIRPKQIQPRKRGKFPVGHETPCCLFALSANNILSSFLTANWISLFWLKPHWIDICGNSVTLPLFLASNKILQSFSIFNICSPSFYNHFSFKTPN